MIEIFDNQRKVKTDRQIFQRFAEFLMLETEEARGKSATVAFVSDRRMRELNRQFRGRDKTTDVLSFPFEADAFDTDENNLGDVVISLEQAARQAADNELTLEREVKQLILHGVLHLCGYDHETDSGEMNRRELELREKLGV